MFLIICILLLICICVGSVIYVQIYKDEQWYYLSVASGSIAFVLIILVMYENFKTKPKKEPQSQTDSILIDDDFNLDLLDDDVESFLDLSQTEEAVPQYIPQPAPIFNFGGTIAGPGANPEQLNRSGGSVRSLQGSQRVHPGWGGTGAVRMPGYNTR